MDYVRQASKQIADNFDVICVEDLNIKQMMMTDKYKLNKFIADSSWGKFLRYLQYKVENTGGYMIRINPKGTSQTCYNCGANVVKDLFQRHHNCPYCKVSIHRDINSAKLILRFGMSLLNSEAKQFIAW